jgi:hypothetical protein
METYQSNLDRNFFNEDYLFDKVFRDGVKPYVKDKGRFERAVKLLNSPTSNLIYDVGFYPGTSTYFLGEKNNWAWERLTQNCMIRQSVLGMNL